VIGPWKQAASFPERQALCQSIHHLLLVSSFSATSIHAHDCRSGKGERGGVRYTRLSMPGAWREVPMRLEPFLSSLGRLR